MFNIDFLSSECRNEFIEIFGSSEFAIEFFIHSYVDFKSKGGYLKKEWIKAIQIAKEAIGNRRNNIYHIGFIYFPPKEFGKECLAVHFEFEEVDPEYWEDEEGNIHSTLDCTLKAVQKELPEYECRLNCGGVDVIFI